MKTSFKSIALAVAFSALFAFSSFADDKEGKKTASFGSAVFASKSGKIHINVDKYANERTAVIVTDQSGKLMYREVLGKGVMKLRTTLNVSDLPTGSYRIEISSKSGKDVKNFSVAEKVAQRTISIK